MSRIRILRGTVPAVAAAAGLLASSTWAPAHADEASYLAALDARGVYFAPPGSRLSAGYKFCNMLRAGQSPGEIVAEESPRLRTFGAPSIVDGLRLSMPQVIEIAQQELCPDTLGG